jgi:hypothetical protein
MNIPQNHNIISLVSYHLCHIAGLFIYQSTRQSIPGHRHAPRQQEAGAFDTVAIVHMPEKIENIHEKQLKKEKKEMKENKQTATTFERSQITLVLFSSCHYNN